MSIYNSVYITDTINGFSITQKVKGGNKAHSISRLNFNTLRPFNL